MTYLNSTCVFLTWVFIFSSPLISWWCCNKTSDPVVLSISGLNPNLKSSAPILDTWPSALAFQAVNKGVEGSALSGRPNLRPSPHILLCTPRPTLTHPLGLTYTLQGPQGSISGFKSSTGLLSSVDSPTHPQTLHAYHSTLPPSLSPSPNINTFICPSLQPIQTYSQYQRPLSFTHLLHFYYCYVCKYVSI